MQSRNRTSTSEKRALDELCTIVQPDEWLLPIGAQDPLPWNTETAVMDMSPSPSPRGHLARATKGHDFLGPPRGLRYLMHFRVDSDSVLTVDGDSAYATLVRNYGCGTTIPIPPHVHGEQLIDWRAVALDYLAIAITHASAAHPVLYVWDWNCVPDPFVVWQLNPRVHTTIGADILPLVTTSRLVCTPRA